MANFSVDLENIQNEGYEDIIIFAKKITSIMEGFKSKAIDYYFNFECDNLRCSANSLEEFIEMTYGSKHFHLIALQILAKVPENEHIRVNYLSNFSASATSKFLLNTFVEKIECEESLYRVHTERYLKDEKEHKENSTTIVINGNNNTVANGNSNVSINELEVSKVPEEKKRGLKGYFYNVFEGVSIQVIGAGLLGLFAIVCGLIVENF